jgi:hypothetical protein
MWSFIYKISIRQLAYIALAGTRATIFWIVFNLCTITLFYSNAIFYLAEVTSLIFIKFSSDSLGNSSSEREHSRA